MLKKKQTKIRDSSKKILSGTGLGLSITKSLVRLLSETITVQSELNNGSEFIINLPLSTFVKEDSLII